MFSKEETLRKAIDKAIRNGWNPKDFTKGTSKEKGKYILKITNDLQIRSIVLSHDFARAFYGNTALCSYCGTPVENNPNYCKCPTEWTWALPAWKYHLQKQAIEPDPLSYLAKFLEDEQ